MLLYFQEDVRIENHWRVSGKHYEKTANAWLLRMDENRDRILPIMDKTYGQSEGKKWFNYWRLFFMACAELWGYERGSQWIVSHYLFSRADRVKSSGRIEESLKIARG